MGQNRHNRHAVLLRLPGLAVLLHPGGGHADLGAHRPPRRDAPSDSRALRRRDGDPAERDLLPSDRG